MKFWIAIFLLIASTVYAKDPDGRYANSPLKGWFDGLQSGKGPCCSDADGTALSDADWEAVRDEKKPNVHYRVKIEDQWWDVPDEAVLNQPNLYGRTMVWPIYFRGYGAPKIDIRCFIPGSMI